MVVVFCCLSGVGHGVLSQCCQVSLTVVVFFSSRLLGVGCRVLISGVGFRVLVVGCWLSGVDYQVLVVGCWLSGVGCRVLAVDCWLSGVG